MSYLNIDGVTLADFTQGVISLWFRVPLATLEKARDAAQAIKDTVPRVPSPVDDVNLQPEYITMAGIVPLVTFGRPQTTDLYQAPQVTAGSYTSVTYTYPGGDLPPPPPRGPWTVQNSSSADYVIQALSINTPAWALPPSYIGIECVAGASDGSSPDLYVLKVHLQMDRADESSKVGLNYYASANVYPGTWKIYSNDQFGVGGIHGPGFSDTGGYGTYVWSNDYHVVVDGQPQPPAAGEIYSGFFWPPNATNTTTTTYTDISGPDTTAPEIFELGGQHSGPPSGSPTALAIEPDHWHHVLISVDLTNEVSTHGYTWLQSNDPSFHWASAKGTDSAAQAWLALDDVNVDGEDLSQFYPKGTADGSVADYSDPNGILTIYANAIATTMEQPSSSSGVAVGSSYEVSNFLGLVLPKFSYTSAGAPINAGSMGLPASVDFVDNVYNVEMAEFQMFTGVALHTGDPVARRAFVDDNGKPVDPNQKEVQDSNGATTQTSGSIEYLGQEPDVLLHSSGNWIKGKNTGGSHDDGAGSGNQIPADQFDPTGKIIRYKPNPSLHGAQSPPSRSGPQLKRKR